MKKFVFLTCTIILCGMLGCKKESIIAEPDEVPVFYFEGNIKGDAVKYEAGNNQYFMNTEYYKDSIFWLKGLFAPKDCNNCNSSLSIELSDYKVRSTNNIDDIMTLVHTGDYLFYDENTAPQMRYTFKTDALISLLPNQKYNWSFGNGDTASGSEVIKDMAINQFMPVTLNVENTSNGCISTIENLMNTSATSCDPNFTYSNINANNFQFVYNGNQSVVWLFDNGLIIDSLHMPQVSFTPGIHTACLNVFDVNNNCQATFCRQFNVSLSGVCFAGYSYTRALITNDIFSKVKISHTNKSGATYVNYVKSQPMGSKFKVLEVLSYDKNEKGEATIKIKVAFNCKLYNKNNLNDAIDIETENCVFAVAFPGN